MTILGAQALAALGAAAGEHLLSILGGHAPAETVTARAHEARRLKGALHGRGSGSKIERRWISSCRGEVNHMGRPCGVAAARHCLRAAARLHSRRQQLRITRLL